MLTDVRFAQMLCLKGACLSCLLQKYGYTHLSAGDLLRDERKRPGSQYGELIENYIKEGEIVPVEITISLLKRVRKGLFPCRVTPAG